jgi:hypothetical protein
MYPNYQIKRNEMGGVHSTYSGEEKYVENSSGDMIGKRLLGRNRNIWEEAFC